MPKAREAISLGISALIVIVIILIAGFGIFLNDTFNTGTTNTSTNVGTVNTSSATLSSSSTPTSATSSSANLTSSITTSPPNSITDTTHLNTTILTTTLPAACSESLGLGGSLEAKENSSATLCVEFYYYGSQTKTFSPLGQLTVTGSSEAGTFDADSNFTVTSSVSNLTIGGSSSENEGALVIYTITPKADSSGTYLLNLGWLAVGQAPNVLNCGMEFLLVSGNGKPNYTSNFTSLCITMTSTGTLPYPYYAGTLFAKVVGSTNNTA